MSGEWDQRHEDDRLPWLETAEEEYRSGPPLWQIALAVLLGLLVIGGIIFAIFHKSHPQPTVTAGGAEMINAQEGDYKVKPDSPGGDNVQGEGDSAIAASQGKDAAGGGVDAKQAAEKPITAKTPAAAATPVATAKQVQTPVPASGGAKAGGALVQLGSYPSGAAANEAWGKLSKKYGYVASLGKAVTQAQVNGRTVYRLRVNAGSAGQAGEICAKLTAAHQPCYIPHD